MGFDGDEIIEREKRRAAQKLKQEADAEKRRKNSVPWWQVALVFVGMALFIFYKFEDETRGHSSGSNASTPKIGQSTITGDAWYGCQTIEYDDKLMNFVAQRDQVAFEKGLKYGLSSGECTRFLNGEKVFVNDVKVFSGRVNIRKEGEVKSYWAPTEAISSK